MSRRNRGLDRRPADAWLAADRRLQAATSHDPEAPDRESATMPAPARAQPQLPAGPQDPPPAAKPGAPYFCRACGRRVVSEEPPTGWYRVQQRDPAQRYSSRVLTTLALLCSPACLAAWAAEGPPGAASATGG